MARSGIAPLSTTIALAFASGSSTTSQRPTPTRITRARIKPPPLVRKRIRRARGRQRETVSGLGWLAIGEPAHAIPPVAVVNRRRPATVLPWAWRNVDPRAVQENLAVALAC